jgi:hypothetical protein
MRAGGSPARHPPPPDRPGRAPASHDSRARPHQPLPGRIIGTKPAAVCRWIFGLPGAEPADSLDELFPGSGSGSGAVSGAWAAFTGHADPSHQARAGASPQVLHDASRPA